MEKAYRNLGYILLLLIPLTFLGFHKTYFVQFPNFEENITTFIHLRAFIASIMIIAGIYSFDAGCFESVTAEGTIHGQVSAITFPSAILGIPLLGISFRKQVAFRKFMWYTLISAVLAGIFMVNMIGTFETSTYTGLWQRLPLLTIFIWTSVIGLSLFKANRET